MTTHLHPTTGATMTSNDTNPGWYADPHDQLVTRYWDGARWTAARRWDGTSWVDQAVPAPAAPAAPVATTATTARTSRTFKMFVGSAFAAALGYVVPVGTVTSEYGASDPRTLGDAGGYGVLVLAAAAATVWMAWPSRNGGVVSRGALWGIGAMAGLIAFFSMALFSAMGTTEENLGYGTISSTVEPGLGLFLLVAAVITQSIGIVMAAGDRRRAGVSAPR